MLNIIELLTALNYSARANLFIRIFVEIIFENMRNILKFYNKFDRCIMHYNAI